MTLPRVLDLFCGAAGGWSVGLSWAGYRTVAGVEIDDWRRSRFAERHPEAQMFKDVREVTADAVEPVDVVVGSPPCVHISAGRRNAGGVDGDGLFFEAVRLVDECRPIWAAFENSSYLRVRGYDRVAAELERAGYACRAFVVRASDLGARHERARVWIIAADADKIPVWLEQGGRGWPGRWHASEPVVAGAGHGADADLSPRALGEGGAADACSGKESAPERGALCRWRDFPASLRGHLRAFDGVPDRVAHQIADAYGDAVVPVIPYLIGRAMRRVVAP